MQKAKDEGGEEGGGGGGTGIILGRLGGARGAGGGGGAQGGGVKSVDSSGIRDLVQKLCQSSHPLAKSMDYMQVGSWDMRHICGWHVIPGISRSSPPAIIRFICRLWFVIITKLRRSLLIPALPFPYCCCCCSGGPREHEQGVPFLGDGAPRCSRQAWGGAGVWVCVGGMRVERESYPLGPQCWSSGLICLNPRPPCMTLTN